MSLFGKKKEEESDETQEQEEEEFNIVKAIEGMTEKQLLKLIVLTQYDNQQETLADDYEELIKMAKEA